MDRYEYKELIDRVRGLIDRKDMEEAARQLDANNWRKVPSVNALMKAAELYEEVGRLDSAKELLMAAHERSPIGRMVIYRLALVCIRLQELDEAQEYYTEFMEIAPHDSLRYVINYQLSRARGVSDEDLITILEDLKENDFLEDWALELALFYQKTRQIDKCVSLCNEIILWFGDGPYVEKALELKMIYAPLDPDQEQIYLKLRQRHRDEIKEISGQEAGRSEKEGTSAETIPLPEIHIPSTKFNTINLQEKIKQNIEEIMSATGSEQVQEKMENIKELTDELPFLRVSEGTKELGAQRARETQKVIDQDLRERYRGLGIDDDGQISMDVPDQSEDDIQIKGQLSIDDLVKDWEKTRKEAEEVLKKAGEKKLESAKAQALVEANEIMERLTEVLPRLEAGASVEDLVEEEMLQHASARLSEAAGAVSGDSSGVDYREARKTVSDINNMLQREIDRLNGGENETAAAAETGEDEAAAAAETGEKNAELTEREEENPATEEQGVERASADEENAEEATENEEMLSSDEEAAEERAAEPAVSEEEDAVLKEDDDQLIIPEFDFHESREEAEPAVEPTASEESVAEDSDEKMASSEGSAVEDSDEKMASSEGPAVEDSDEKMASSEESAVEDSDEKVASSEESAVEDSEENTAGAGDPDEKITGSEESASEEQTGERSESEESASEKSTEESAQPVLKGHISSRFGDEEFVIEEEDEEATAENADAEEEPAKTEQEEKADQENKEEVRRDAIEEAFHMQATRASWVTDDQEFNSVESMQASNVFYNNAAAEPKAVEAPRKLTDEEKARFSSYVAIEGMEAHLSRALEGVKEGLLGDSKKAHLKIIGSEGSGKTNLATGVIELMQRQIKLPAGPAGKIDAARLNEKNVIELFDKIRGGALIIEKAGALSRVSVATLNTLLDTDTSGVLMILEGDMDSLQKMFAMNRSFASKFVNEIRIPVFTTDELVAFGRTYANDNGCSVDSMGVLALYNRINMIQKIDQPTSLSEVIEIVDQAMDRVKSGGLKKKFSRLGSKRSDAEGRLILHEKDFEA